ncbi:hypothetical protein ABK905_23220 [Acerihabitans sp. KWT182]|uniref:Uncharacterized protein n=1 Tax=Acerihabitans sp. KWT182 TaxID=3157919 RepID=A0AAU7Q8G1_9GAMM
MFDEPNFQHPARTLKTSALKIFHGEANLGGSFVQTKAILVQHINIHKRLVEFKLRRKQLSSQSAAMSINHLLYLTTACQRSKIKSAIQQTSAACEMLNIIYYFADFF